MADKDKRLQRSRSGRHDPPRMPSMDHYPEGSRRTFERALVMLERTLTPEQQNKLRALFDRGELHEPQLVLAVLTEEEP